MGLTSISTNKSGNKLSMIANYKRSLAFVSNAGLKIYTLSRIKEIYRYLSVKYRNCNKFCNELAVRVNKDFDFYSLFGLILVKSTVI